MLIFIFINTVHKKTYTHYWVQNKSYNLIGFLDMPINLENKKGGSEIEPPFEIYKILINNSIGNKLFCFWLCHL